MNRRVLVIAALSLGLAGCGGLRGWSKTAVEPPAPLPTLTSAVSVNTRWTVNVGGKSEERFPYLAPALGGSRVYAAGADGQVVAVGLNRGNVAWRVKTESRITGGAFWGGDKLLVGTLDGEVLALAATDGRIRWRRQMSSEVLATPRAEQGIVVVRTLDGRISGLDLNDGSTRWTHETTVPSLTLRGTGAPVLENGFAMIGLDNGKVIALRLSDGRLAWEETVALPTGRSEVERLVDIDGDPAVLAGGLFVATFQGKVAGFDLRSGRRVWDRDTSSFQSIVASGDEIYEVDDRSRVNALDLQTGAVRWTQEGLLRRNLSAPALSGRHVIVADGDGYVFWLDRGTGQITGYTRIDRKGISARPLRVGDETVVVQGRGGRLAAVQFGRD